MFNEISDIAQGKVRLYLEATQKGIDHFETKDPDHLVLYATHALRALEALEDLYNAHGAATLNSAILKGIIE